MSKPWNSAATLADWIRRLCALELGEPHDYPFFHCDYLPGEDPDAALVRIFRAERVHCHDDIETILVLCHG